MTGFRINVDSEELGRVMGNALAFFPARSPIPTAELLVWPDRIMATGTDTYTIGRDWCDAHNFQCVDRIEPPLSIELDRDGWKEIEAQARKDRGTKDNPAGPGTLEYRPGDCLTFYPGGDKAEQATAKDVTGILTPKLSNGETMRDVWDLSQELLERMTETPAEQPDRMTFDPTLFGRFQKVKVSKSVDADKVLDFIWQGQGEPMLAKVGPTFVGAIMTIDRGAYNENQPEGSEEMLW